MGSPYLFTNAGGGTTIAPWVKSTSLTTAGFGTISLIEVYTKTIGDTFYMRGKFTVGTPTAVPARIDLPSVTIDYNKITTVADIGWCGGSINVVPGAANSIFSQDRAPVIFADGSDTDSVFFAYQVASGVLVKVNGDAIWASGHRVLFDFSLPIVV